jgi:hypothetical protein
VLSSEELPPLSSDEELPLFEEDEDELPDEEPEDEVDNPIPPVEPPDVEEPNVAKAPVMLDTVLDTFVPTDADVEPLTAPAFPAQGLEPGGDAALIEATQAS